MKINIQAPFEVNDHLKSVIQEKLEKLNTFHDRIINAKVFLKMGDDTKHAAKIVEISLSIPGKDAFAKDTEDTFEKAVASVADKLERQLKKRKDKLSDKYR